LYAIPIIVILLILRCLNNTKTCTALKGAALKNFYTVYAKRNYWINKRSTEFDTYQNPPRPFGDYEIKRPDLMPLRPVPLAAAAHRSNPHTANTTMTVGHLHAQQRLGNVHIPTPNMHPNPEHAEQEFAEREAGFTPPPPAYNPAPIIRTLEHQQHKYNTRSQVKSSPNNNSNSKIVQPIGNTTFDLK